MKPLYNCPKCGISWRLEKLSERKYWCKICKVGIVLKDDKFKIIRRTLLIRIVAVFRLLIFGGLTYLTPALLVYSLYFQVFGPFAMAGLKHLLALLPGAVLGLFIFCKTNKSFTRFSDGREMLKTFEGGRLSRWKRRGRAR